MGSDQKGFVEIVEMEGKKEETLEHLLDSNSIKVSRALRM